MKTIFVLLATCSLLTPALGSACLPPPGTVSNLQMQKTWLDKVLSDKAVVAEITEIGHDAEILSIELGESFKITLSNGCQFSAETNFAEAGPGACPILLPLKVTNKICQNSQALVKATSEK